MRIKESSKMKKETCPQYKHLNIVSIKILLWNSIVGSINWMTAWMESIELIKLHLDTQGDLLRFQRNTELKRNNK